MQELKAYIEAKTKLDEMFGGAIGTHAVDDMTGVKFSIDDHEVIWFDEDGEEYCYDVVGAITTDKSGGFAAVPIRDCFGTAYIGIFDNTNKLT